ncbi:MAG: hypothetical protein HYZ53_27665 [Planctomycetes bacterium]|nr:hypothetical protein [Planctomycetota bacterium]
MWSADVGRLLGKAALLLPIPLGVLLTNFLVDPDGAFDGARYEQAVARLLAEGRNVVPFVTPYERAVLRSYAEAAREGREVLFLGSSRSLQVGAEAFPSRSFFNAWASSSVLEDYLAIYRLFERCGHAPRVLGLGVDPWIFNRNNGTHRWTELEDEYREMRARLPGEAELGARQAPLVGERYGRLASAATFQRSLRALVLGEWLKRPIRATDATEDEDPVKRADGSMSYPRSVRERGVAEVRRLAVEFARRRPIAFLAGFTELDPELRRLFEAFVRYVRAQGIDVVFYLPPFHPTAYELVVSSEDGRMLVEVERYLRALAGREGLAVYGSYDPAQCECGEGDFYDSHHPRHGTNARIFARPSRGR